MRHRPAFEHHRPASMFARVVLCVVASTLGGCINMWAAYERDAPSDGPPHDPHEPRSLAGSLLTSPGLTAYTDDGERYAVHRCKRYRDDRLACHLAFGRRERGIDDVWPVDVRSNDFDRGGRRAIRDLLADRLDDLDAHLMTATHAPGPRVMVDGGQGARRFVVELDGTRLQLGFSPTASHDDVQPLAAVTLEKGRLTPSVRVLASRRRRDMVAVELWVEVDEPAVAAYNAWVLFFKRSDNRWMAQFIRPRRDVLFSRFASLNDPAPEPTPAPPVSPEPRTEPTGPLRVEPAPPAAPTAACKTDADCQDGRRCCRNGRGARGCRVTAGNACPKLP